jgi:HlyD family secretion protein
MPSSVFGNVKRPSRWLLVALLLGLLGTSGGLWFWLRQRTPPYDVAALTTPVVSQPITIRITASGTVEPIQTVNLSPKAAGIIQSLLVEQGDRVEQGQIIARMDSNDLTAQLQQRQASLAEAEAQLRDTQQGTKPAQLAQAEANLAAVTAQVRDASSRLDLASNNVARDQALFNRGAISQLELDRSINEVRSARAGVAQAQSRVEEARQRFVDLKNEPDADLLAASQARVDQARAQLQVMQIQLADTVIRAPFAGIITQKFATEGAFVTPTTSASTASSATSTAVVALAEGLEVVAEIPEADISQIRPGQSVEIQADAFPETIFKGTVRLIAPEAIEKQNVTVFQVRVQLLTGQTELRSKMTVNVAFIGEQLKAALVVPAVAVVTQGGETGVLIPDQDARLRFRPVILGPQVGDQIQILDGLKVGERVFTTLPPGQTLENLRFSRDQPR